MMSNKPWRVEVVLMFCAAQAFFLFLGLTVISILLKYHVPGFKNPEDFGNPLLATLSFQGATWILIPIFLGLHGVKISDAFGLKWEGWWLAVALAVATIAVVLPVAEVLNQLSLMVLGKFGWKPHEEEAVTLVAGAKALWMRIYLDVFAVVLAPVAEEFIFRGVLYNFIKQLGSPRLALYGVSALFALIHGDAAIAVPLFILALALTWLYEKTDNLLAPILAHGLFNGANLILLSYVSKWN
jgi:membrane protease YdiL (CAAX protease family)